MLTFIIFSLPMLLQTFSREERGGAACVRVSNIQTHLVSHWDMAKFETRLDQMRDIYHLQDSTHSLSSTYLASADSDDPFNDPSDGWTPSPLRWVGLDSSPT